MALSASDQRSLPASPARQVLALAGPALLTLLAEPLFLLVDTAVVGRLGTAPLGGLGIASAVLLTAVNLFVFLAYGTTALVARRTGAGDARAALAAGVDGVWLALLLGAGAALVTWLLAPALVAGLGASPLTAPPALAYLRVAALGIPPMLVSLAATGVLRGLQDTRTPLAVTTAAFALNAALNVAFVLGLGWGITGSAWGTVIAQTLMAVALTGALLPRIRRLGVPLRLHAGGVLRAARDGVPLLVRTLSLRAVMLLTTWAAAGLGDTELAAHQVAMTVWTTLAFALDALAIAAQALTGRALGAGDAPGTRALTALMVRWGVGAGVALGVLVLLAHRALPPLFSPDPGVQAALAAALVVVALGQPLSGLVFVLDGVLIGAGDARWLALAQTLVLAAYVPVVLAVARLAPAGAATSLAWLWAGFTVFMALRGAALAHRARSDAWLRTGTA